jgi:hypothetical protein
MAWAYHNELASCMADQRMKAFNPLSMGERDGEKNLAPPLAIGIYCRSQRIPYKH